MTILPNKYQNELRLYPTTKLSGVKAQVQVGSPRSPSMHRTDIRVQNLVHRWTYTTLMIESNLHFRVLQNKLTAELPKFLDIAKTELEYGWPVDIPQPDGTHSFLCYQVHSFNPCHRLARSRYPTDDAHARRSHVCQDLFGPSRVPEPRMAKPLHRFQHHTLCLRVLSPHVPALDAPHHRSRYADPLESQFQSQESPKDHWATHGQTP